MSESLNENKFVYGVLDTFELMATRDIAVVGRQDFYHQLR